MARISQHPCVSQYRNGINQLIFRFTRLYSPKHDMHMTAPPRVSWPSSIHCSPVTDATENPMPDSAWVACISPVYHFDPSLCSGMTGEGKLIPYPRSLSFHYGHVVHPPSQPVMRPAEGKIFFNYVCLIKETLETLKYPSQYFNESLTLYRIYK